MLLIIMPQGLEAEEAEETRDAEDADHRGEVADVDAGVGLRKYDIISYDMIYCNIIEYHHIYIYIYI